MKLIAFLASGLAATAVALADPANYTAHEWGTFTSVQGSDGTALRWNPLVTSDLPGFVHTRRIPAKGATVKAASVTLSLLGLKDSTHWLQRMETPVIYFHSDEPRRVDVHVGFPKGLITEWYPAANTYGPFFGATNLLPEASESFTQWTDLEILPRDTQLNPDANTTPKESAPSHYYAARDVRSNPVRTSRGVGSSPDGAGEVEQFLFYRGVADFASPLKVSNTGSDIVLQNTGRDALTQLFVWEARGTKASLTPVKSLPAGASHHTAGDTGRIEGERGKMTREFKYRLQTALVGDGLNQDEAAAMIQTWADSWFDEDGTRVLYLVPRSFTDSVLPLKLTPEPRQVARVFVGRAELLTADVEQQAAALAEKFRKEHDAQVAKELGRLVVSRFSDSLINRLQSREIAATEALVRVEPSIEPLDKRLQVANQKIYDEFNALRIAAQRQ